MTCANQEYRVRDVQLSKNMIKESKKVTCLHSVFRKPGGVSLADRNLRKDKAGKDGGSHFDTIRYLPITGAGRTRVTLTSGRLFTCPGELC